MMMLKLLAIGILAASLCPAQRGGKRGGAASGAGGSEGGEPVRFVPTFVDRTAGFLRLTSEQKKALRTTLEAAYKEAEPLRKAIPRNRAQIAAAVQAGRNPAEMKPLLDAQGSAVASMTQIEMQAFAKVYNSLDESQKKAARQDLFLQLNGVFLKRNWNE